MSERDDAIKLANQVLERPMADPDDDLAILSRQLLRQVETVERLKGDLVAMHDPTADMIHANRDAMLSKHDEAIRLIRDALKHNRHALCGLDRIEEILDALAMFHPMHGESWKGWSASGERQEATGERK